MATPRSTVTTPPSKAGHSLSRAPRPGFDGTVEHTTNASGQLSFDGIASGTYTVTEETRDGWAPTTPVTQLVEVTDEGSVTVTFHNRPFGDLRVEKTTLEDGEPIDEHEGWTITVTGCGYNAVETTGADGVAMFNDVPVCDDITVQEDPDSKPDFAAVSGTSRETSVSAGQTTVETFTNERITVSETPTPTPTSTPETETPTPTPTGTPETETPTPTPTSTPETETPTPEDPTATPEPTETPEPTATVVDEVEGEQTPGPTSTPDDSGTSATPVAPDSGTGYAVSGGSPVGTLLLLGILAFASGLAFIAMGRRRSSWRR
ncbi:MAG: hypothetical protein U5Q44_03015 [Dehalococcoidia bacterium]|nr:hypothetical protein [Dehalococcoidia bacterium]